MNRFLLKLAIPVLAFAAGAAVGAIVVAFKKNKTANEQKPQETKTPVEQETEPADEEVVHHQMGSICGAKSEDRAVTCEGCLEVIAQPYHHLPSDLSEFDEGTDEVEFSRRGDGRVMALADRVCNPEFALNATMDGREPIHPKKDTSIGEVIVAEEPETTDELLRDVAGEPVVESAPEPVPIEVVKEPAEKPPIPIEVAPEPVKAHPEVVQVKVSVPDPTEENPRGRHYTRRDKVVIGNEGEIVNAGFFEKALWLAAASEEKEMIIDKMSDTTLRRRIVVLGGHVEASSNHFSLVQQVLRLEEDRLTNATAPKSGSRRPRA